MRPGFPSFVGGVLIAALALLRGPAAGQRPAASGGRDSAAAAARQPDTGKAALNSALLAAAGANRMVRLHSFAGEEWQGRVGGVSETSARIGGRIVPLANQRQLEERLEHPDPVWNGTLIGATAAVVILYPPLAAFARSMGERPLTTGEKVSGVVGTALLGGMIGLLVDESIHPPPEWRTVWRAGSGAGDRR